MSEFSPRAQELAKELREKALRNIDRLESRGTTGSRGGSGPTISSKSGDSDKIAPHGDSTGRSAKG
jgi:hypothetical protein